MTSPGRGELGVIESEAFDFSQLEEYINDDNENNIYFHDALVTSSDLKLTEVPEKSSPFARSGHQGLTAKDSVHLAAEGTEGRGHGPVGQLCGSQTGIDSSHSPQATTAPQQKGYAVRNVRNNSVDVSSSFTKPHHLPDSPPDSGSEPPFSPPNEDPKLKCPSIDLLHHHHHSHHHHHLQPAVHPSSATPEGLKHYINFGLPPLKHDVSSTSPTSSSSSPHHMRHQSPVSPVPVHSTHSASMPVLTPSSANSISGQLLTQIPVMSSFVGNSLQQQLLTSAGSHMGHLYAGSEEFLYENLANPVSSTTTSKKRKLPDSPKIQRNHQNGNSVQVKIEPSIPSSPDPTTTVLPSSDEDYSFELSAAEANALFVDSSFQCIRFQSFQPNTWSQLLDKDMKEISHPNFRVDADKGFNYSNADESFVCQKKNHFQVTVHVQPVAEAHYVRTAAEGTIRAIEKFSLQFHGVKMESPSQTIKVEQSQSDRSKRPFLPVPLEMITDQLTKTTVGRLHFSETTSNNMRKKGKPNPDQRFFFLVVSLCAHVAGDVPATVVAHSSEKIIVRASNPGQFENDMELSWQKGHTLDSIFHNGRVGINTDRPEESLVVHGNIKVTGHILQPSDLRAKFDIHELDTREQLQNVANLRIVRYRYLPEFGDQVGLTQMSTDTGVIAQEVRHILPEAVIEAGDVLLKDGKLIEKLLVVNKERIFMENVGAVKELCKVTDNLENRIGQLERINRKLTSLKRKDSIKSTCTDLSRMSSGACHGKHRCHRSCGKQGNQHQVKSCSNHFLQSSIVVLLVIMACCLMALATLWVMEWQTHQSHIRDSFLIQMDSTPSSNTRTSTKDRSHVLSTLFPSVTLSSQYASPSTKKTTSDTMHGITPKQSTKSTASKTSSPVPDSDDRFYGFDMDCPPEECPVFCCDHYPDIDEDSLPDDENSLRHHVEKKSGTRVGFELKGPDSDNTESPKNEELVSWQQQLSKESVPENNNQQSLSLNPHRLRKRIIEAEEESVENSQFFKTEYSSDPIFHLLELNATLLPELCTEERLEDTSVVYISCSVYISRHFPHRNITLHIRTEDSDAVFEYCGSTQYLSCPREVLKDERSQSSNNIDKREVISQSHTWQLPVGSFIRSRYRFRMMSRRFATDQQKASDVRPWGQQVSESILWFCSSEYGGQFVR